MKTRARWRRRGWLALVAGLVPMAGAQPPVRPPDALVKAALLHRFPSFVEWPAGTFPAPDTPLRIAIHGDEQVAQALRELAADRPRDGRPVQVRLLRNGEAPADAHVLYVRGRHRAEVTELIRQAPPGVLTVADFDGEHVRGSVLSLLLEEDRVRFSASVDAAARQQLRLSSRLLAVARAVHGG